MSSDMMATLAKTSARLLCGGAPRRRLLAAAAVAVIAAAPARAEGPIVELIAAVKPSVVAIGTGGPRDEILGTGFAVGDGAHILTALHLVRGAPAGGLSVFVGKDRKPVKVTQVAADADHDMVLLKIEGQTLPALRLFLGKQLEEGEEVAFTGFPLGAAHGLYPATHRGTISAILPIAPGKADAADRAEVVAYQLDATSLPGNSGGPMVDPADGSVVGIVDSTYVQDSEGNGADRTPGITFAMPIPPAIELLKKAGLQP